MANNVTPITPEALPYTYTANFGQAYQLASVSQQGCVDTVYPLTANAAGDFNVKGVPLTAPQAYAIIEQANNQFGPEFIACQSLLDQLPASGTSSSGTTYLDLSADVGANLGYGWFVDDILFLVGIGVLVWIGVFIFDMVEKATKRGRR